MDMGANRRSAHWLPRRANSYTPVNFECMLKSTPPTTAKPIQKGYLHAWGCLKSTSRQGDSLGRETYVFPKSLKKSFIPSARIAGILSASTNILELDWDRIKRRKAEEQHTW